MSSVIVSSKYGVVIPRETRERLDAHPGQRKPIISFENRLELATCQ